MNLSEKTKKYIEVIEKQLSDSGILEDADRENLQFLAEAVELYHRGLDALEEGGLIVTDQKGRVVANPAFSIVRSSQSTITALLKELSVSARQRRLMTKDAMIDDSSPLDDFVEKVGELF